MAGVKSIFVLQYEAYIEDEWRAIVRYDEAHGFFHRDILWPSGQQDKSPQAVGDKGLALTEAIADIKEKRQAYRKAYEDKYYGRR